MSITFTNTSPIITTDIVEHIATQVEMPNLLSLLPLQLTCCPADKWEHCPCS